MKNNLKKIILAIAIGFLLSGAVVSAAEVLYSKNFTYSTSNSTLSSTNVQTAIDELAIKLNSINNDQCSSKYKCYKKKSSPEVGDYVKMTPTLTSYTTDKSKTGYTSTQTINPSELNLWRVLKVNSNGTIEMISEYTSSTSISFKGQTGYQNFVGYLNVLASKYENSKYTSGSRYVGYNGQTQYITDTSKLTNNTTAPWTSSTGSSTIESQGGGETLYQNDYNLIQNVLGIVTANKIGTTDSNNYWIASRYYVYDSSKLWYYELRYVNAAYNISSNILYTCLYGSCSNNNFNVSSALRPIVILKSGITYTPAIGTSDNPFVLN